MNYYSVIHNNEVMGTYEWFKDAESFRVINGYDSIRYYDSETSSWLFNVNRELRQDVK